MTAVDAYLPLGLTAEDLMAYAIGVVTFGSVVLVWRTCWNGNRKRRGRARWHGVGRNYRPSSPAPAGGAGAPSSRWA